MCFSAAQTGKANESLYCASKWGCAFSRILCSAELKGLAPAAGELHPSGIRSEFWENSIT